MTEKTKVIGLCGRSGSGKGYVCNRFLQYGIPSIDTDKVYRDILSREGSECLFELIHEFGESIAVDGKLDRRALASIVFAKGNEDKLRRLNEISHKHILKETRLMISQYEKEGAGAVIVDAPVLFESGFDSICDITLCVTAPDSVCIRRICERDGRSEEEAKSRLASQKSVSELREICSFEIVNDGVSDVDAQIAAFVEKYSLEVRCEKE